MFPACERQTGMDKSFGDPKRNCCADRELVHRPAGQRAKSEDRRSPSGGQTHQPFLLLTFRSRWKPCCSTPPTLRAAKHLEKEKAAQLSKWTSDPSIVSSISTETVPPTAKVDFNMSNIVGDIPNQYRAIVSSLTRAVKLMFNNNQAARCGPEALRPLSKSFVTWWH